MAKILERVGFGFDKEQYKVAFEGSVRECVAYIHKHVSSEFGVRFVMSEKARKRVDDIYDDAWYNNDRDRMNWAMDWQNRYYGGYYRAFVYKSHSSGKFAFYEVLDDDCCVKYMAHIWTEAELPVTKDQLGIYGGGDDNKVYFV